MAETIQNYTGTDPVLKAAYQTLELFICDVDNWECDDDGTFDCSDAVRALNVLLMRANQ